MFSFFKNIKYGKPANIGMDVNGVNPETENEFLFFNFVEQTPAYILEPWIIEAKRQGLKVNPKYHQAINQKIATDQFRNPHRFPEYFDNSFDYIAIDFETANNNRISACAIGLCFIKNNKIVFTKKELIQPPKGEVFLRQNTNIHGIMQSDVVSALDFGELWNLEFSKYFLSNLIVFHNASMDLSVLKNLYNHYSITPFKIQYIDTMYFADKIGLPRKIVDLAYELGIELIDHHNPEEDAKLCGLILGALIDRFPEYKNFIKVIDDTPKESGFFFKPASDEVLAANELYKEDYAINSIDLEHLEISDKGFVVTGEFDMKRTEIKDFIEKHNGIIKPGISKSVNYVITGADCGWAKIQKINELNNSKKANIRILNEKDLNHLIMRYGL